jgi:apolipoprotein N-acyltransferase
MQHLSMAVFRSVENRRSMTRSTASGQTCAVAPDGKILAMAEAFTEAALTVSVPVVTERTFYTKHGDYLPRLFLAAALLMFTTGALRLIRQGFSRKSSV